MGKSASLGGDGDDGCGAGPRLGGEAPKIVSWDIWAICLSTMCL